MSLDTLGCCQWIRSGQELFIFSVFEAVRQSLGEPEPPGHSPPAASSLDRFFFQNADPVVQNLEFCPTVFVSSQHKGHFRLLHCSMLTLAKEVLQHQDIGMKEAGREHEEGNCCGGGVRDSRYQTQIPLFTCRILSICSIPLFSCIQVSHMVTACVFCKLCHHLHFERLCLP